MTSWRSQSVPLGALSRPFFGATLTCSIRWSQKGGKRTLESTRQSPRGTAAAQRREYEVAWADTCRVGIRYAAT